MEEKVKKVTKKENFEAIKAILEGMEGTEDLVKAMEHEIAQVSKKRAASSKTAEANKELAEIVYDVLANATKGMTATDILNAINEEGGNDAIKSNQKVTALIKVLADRVEGVKAGKKTLYKVAGADFDVEDAE